MAKFCQNCGSALSEGTKFCPSCGAHVLQSARPAQPQQPQQPLYQQTQPQQPQRQYTQSQVYIPEQFARRNAARAQQNNPRSQQSVRAFSRTMLNRSNPSRAFSKTTRGRSNPPRYRRKAPCL